ncbi:MAG: sulfatase-like hydrolase/transferase [Bacteroidetes bacterium]|nr:sulfatase-like hydrolase/transferase [Bacteroidota bacterium]MDA1119965.1 sulfatase-like hydrolase/transferase [Bacteroidota bacterium]
MRFVNLVFFLISFGICVSCGLSSIESDRPNIVVILVDDYGYGDISFEGNTQIQTPNIDRIAKEGVRLTNFYQSSGANKEDLILQNIGFELANSSKTAIEKVEMNQAVIDFQTQEGMPGKTVNVKGGKEITIRPFLDNPEMLKSITVFMDFESNEISEDLHDFTIITPESGRHSLNVEFEHLSGIRNSARIDLIIEN